MRSSFPRVLPSLLSTGALVVASAVSTGCTVSVGPAGAAGTPPPATDTPAGAAPAADEPLTAYLVAEGAAPVPIEGLELHASPAAAEELTAAGCGALVKPGPPGARFRAGAKMPAAFVDWASAEIAREPSRGRFEIAVAGPQGWKCAVDIAAPVLASLVLQAPPGAPARLAWDVRTEPRPVGPGDLVAPPPDDDPVPIGLLLPAVQKVREAAARPAADLPLFPADVLAPPFEGEISEETHADLFDGAPDDETELGVLVLGPSSPAAPAAPDVITGAGPGSVGRMTFTVPLKKAAIASSRTKMNAIPIAGFALMPTLTEARLTAARAQADELKTSGEATLALDEVSRLILALENQPAGSAAPQTRREELLRYWRGDPAKGTPGSETSFKSGLAAFLRKASNVEGLWAYSRLVTAARIFARLDTPEGRAREGADAARIARGRTLADAALRSLEEAKLPMTPGPLRAASGEIGHDYRPAGAAVAMMGEVAPLLGGPAPLAGVEPDEIDVAIAARRHGSPAVGAIDVAANQLLLTLDRVLVAPAVTDADLTDLADQSAALVAELQSLQAVTKVRFNATQAP